MTEPSASTDFPLTDRFAQALGLAHRWHTGQYRKGGGVPYLSHLLGVASIALEFGATEDQAIAALLHDALEDGPQYTGRHAADLRLEIERTFGPEVARLVEASTDAAPEAGQSKAPWAERKTAYLAALPAKDAASLLVSAADKLHNARTILTDLLTRPAGEREAYFDRFSQRQGGTLQYYRRLADAYRSAPAASGRLAELLNELERTVTALESASGVTAEQVRAYPHLPPT